MEEEKSLWLNQVLQFKYCNSRDGAKQALEFEYEFHDGHCRAVKLMDWTETGRYVQGSDTADGLWKTFRIDCVRAYHNDGANLLKHPTQPKPPRPQRDTKQALELRVIGYKKLGSSTAKKDPKQLELEELAQAHQFKVVQSQTKNLTYLVCGPDHSPKVAKRAREAGCYLLTPDQLGQLVEAGVLPDSQTPPRSGSPYIERLGPEYNRYFDLWAFDIQPQHWSAFGVSLGKFTEEMEPHIDAETGSTSPKNQTYQAWSRAHHWYDFHVGDVFYSRSDKTVYLQGADLRDAENLEIHQGLVGKIGTRKAYLAQSEQFAYWLKTGLRPDALQPIDQGNSRAGLLAWQLTNS